MHRGEHARAHQEGADEREREGEDREQDRPDLQGLALLHHHRGVQQRGADEPRHQRRVLDRIPEPPAAPAELVIGPVRAHRDAEGETHPGDEQPRPHPARPGGIDPPLDQGGDREGERDREADIAEIEHRRMDGEADVLQHRIEVAAFERRGIEAQERVRRRQDEEVERGGDPGLHREHGRLEGRRDVVAEQRDEGAEQGEDEHPQQHRAFVVAPGAGELVDQRHRRVRILEHVADREVGADVARDERGEGKRDEAELRDRNRLGDRHQRGVAGARADERHRRLDERQCQRQHQRVMADLHDHRTRPFVTSLTRANPLPLKGGGSGWGSSDSPTSTNVVARDPLPTLPFSGGGEGAAEALARNALVLVLVLPMPLLLQGVGDILGHVALVMLGEHVVSLEHAGAVERPLGDDALPFAEQVRAGCPER